MLAVYPANELVKRSKVVVVGAYTGFESTSRASITHRLLFVAVGHGHSELVALFDPLRESCDIRA
jgi:hypothetical protein